VIGEKSRLEIREKQILDARSWIKAIVKDGIFQLPPPASCPVYRGRSLCGG
jgi:hypothetical protein